jgi:hypothetical protein
MDLSLLLGKSVRMTVQASALWYYLGKHLPHERKRMMLSLPGSACVHWLWYVLLCVSLGGCSPTYHFRYQYTMVTPDGSNEGFENERVRVHVTPTAEAGVLQLMVLNKSAQPIHIIWTQTRYVDPLGQTHPAMDARAAGLFGAPSWPATGTRLMPNEAFQGTLRPGGFRTARQPSLSPYAGQPDLRLPPDPEFQPSGRPMERASANPFIVSRSTGGEVAVSTAPQPLLPTGGNTPTLGQAYQGREFRFILALQFDAGVISYTFTFRITNVEVRTG